MRCLALVAIIAALLISVIAGCIRGRGTSQAHAEGPGSPKKTLSPFRSEAELAKFLRKIADEQKRSRRNFASDSAMPASPAEAKKSDDESVTNVQHAGVDEGGIVKLHGNYLVVLRRGRLFTVAIGDNDMKPISAVDAFGPEIDPRGAWYDEMLISGETIAVIGYSYARGGTEVGLFRIDQAGQLTYQSTYHLRSNDYYSSRNYASRLIGNKLIFYAPLYLWPRHEDPFGQFPALRKWHNDVKESDFRRIVKATRVYRAEQDMDTSIGLALHTVTVCVLGKGELDCEASSVVAAPGRVFYVSPESVYVWTTEWRGNGERKRSMLYRMPLDGSSPSALKVSGSPVDQFSFLESADRHLNVLVRSDAAGDGMWAAEVAAGDVALMRVPLYSFSEGSRGAPATSYRTLPKPEGYTFQNRFVGDYLLYGTGSGGRAPQRGQSKVYTLRWTGGDVFSLQLSHGVDRIEAMGESAVVIGTDGSDLHFTAVRLGEEPEVAYSYSHKEASQGELRSHGFFYKADGLDSGMLGLPIRGPGKPGYVHLREGSASVLFLRNMSSGLSELGELKSHLEGSVDDACRASCVDWYGNARPLFISGRIFALLGYELVEGMLSDGRIREVRRINYSPQRTELTAK